MQRVFSKIRSSLIAWCISEEDIEIGKFHDLNSPEEVQINDSQDKLKFIEQTKVSQYLVKTDTGYSKVKHSFKTIEYQVYEVQLENGLHIRCADNHILFNQDFVEVFVKDLKVGVQIQTKVGLMQIVEIIVHDFFENMFDLELQDKNHRYYTNDILSHNTITIAIFLLWVSIFQKDQQILIASKNNAHATEILDRMKYAYEELPFWLKPGCVFYNRHSLKFDNGSIIRSESTTEKTGRGLSISWLYVDELAFVDRRIQEAMWSSLAPTLATGGRCIISSTPNGDSDLFATLWRGAQSGTNNFIPFTANYYQHPERGPDSGYYEMMLKQLGEIITRQEVLNEFVSSDALLIKSMRLNELQHFHYIDEDNGFKFWEPLYQSPVYLVGADISTGSGNDFSVIQVFDFPALNQIAEYRSNSLHIPELYEKLKWIVNKLSMQIGKRRCETFWTFERNSIGEAISSLYTVDENPPEFADLINDVPGKIGMVTTNKSKVLACLQLKTLVEKIKNGINIRSEIDIFELKNFVSTGAGYAAKSGATDDTVSALLLIVRLIKYIADFDHTAAKILYQYDESDYESFDIETDDAPMSIVFG